MVKHMRLNIVALAVVAGLGACAPGPPPNSGGGDEAPRIVSERPLHTALYEPPALGGGKFGTNLASLRDYTLLFGGQLADSDSAGNPTPRLAADIPSLQAGSWRVHADSRMETTHRLKPSLTWHDGAPFTVDDVLFTWRAIMNPALPVGERNPERLIESIEPLDAQTFQILWREIFIYADAYDLEPLPKHILDPLLQQDPQNFVNSGFWTMEWVGLGPYRLSEWVPGSHVRGQAFSNYALGAPKIQEVFVHFVAGAQPTVAGVLAGTIDLPLGDIIQADEGMLLRQELERKGEGTVLTRPFSMRVGSIQFRDPRAPAARDLRVRQAMVHAVDRPLMVESLHFGITVPADTFVFPSDAAFARVDRSITKLPHDPSRAAQLLAEAGWARGPDRVLRDPGGQPFSLEIQALEGTQYVKEAQVIADSWEGIGIAPELKVIPRSRQNDREFRAGFTGTEVHSYSPGPGSFRNWRVDQIPAETTRWQGGNRGGYVNPGLHQLAVDYDVTFDRPKREDMLVQVLSVVSEEVPTIPFYYTVRVYAVRSGLQGVDPTALGDGYPMFNVHQMHWTR